MGLRENIRLDRLLLRSHLPEIGVASFLNQKDTVCCDVPQHESWASVAVDPFPPRVRSLFL